MNSEKTSQSENESVNLFKRKTKYGLIILILSFVIISTIYGINNIPSENFSDFIALPFIYYNSRDFSELSRHCINQIQKNLRDHKDIAFVHDACIHFLVCCRAIMEYL